MARRLCIGGVCGRVPAVVCQSPWSLPACVSLRASRVLLQGCCFEQASGYVVYKWDVSGCWATACQNKVFGNAEMDVLTANAVTRLNEFKPAGHHTHPKCQATANTGRRTCTTLPVWP